MRRSLFLLAGLATASSVFAAPDGEAVYQAVCRACHETGVDNAPRFGDRARWQRLNRKGLDEIVPAALAGIRKMPPKGGAPERSDLEVARAVVFMANAGGGRFPEPDEAAAARWRQAADRRKRR